MKKRILKTISICVCFAVIMSIAGAYTINAETANTETSIRFSDQIASSKIEVRALSKTKPFDVYNLRGIGKISVKQSLIIDGVENNLFCTFDDPQVALDDLLNAIPKYLMFLRSEYGLDEISLVNLDAYEEKMFVYEQYLIDNKLEDELIAVREESKVLASFCRIYHLDDRNAAIIQTARGTRSDRSLADLAVLLPSFAPLAEEYNSVVLLASQAYTSSLESSSSVFSASSAFNVSSGIQYASQHALYPNTSEYTYFSGGDCTNFVSQICHYGGVPMVNSYPNRSAGWWFVKASTTQPWTYLFDDWSNSWTVASAFTTYMGKSYQTYNFPTFSTTVQAGDFIAIDEDGVGNYHHMGFVTSIGTSGTYNGLYYRDFKIAQHTTNYHDWVSSSTCGWENGNGKALYCIVVRR